MPKCSHSRQLVVELRIYSSPPHDPRLTVSGMQCFDGEDLEYERRRKLQQKQLVLVLPDGLCHTFNIVVLMIKNGDMVVF